MAKQRQGTLELKFIFLLLAIIFVIFLLFPMLMIAIQSLSSGQGMTTNFMEKFLQSPGLEKR